MLNKYERWLQSNSGHMVTGSFSRNQLKGDSDNDEDSEKYQIERSLRNDPGRPFDILAMSMNTEDA